MARDHSLFFIYHSLLDPITRTTVMPHVQALAGEGTGKVLLVSFERSPYRLGSADQREKQRELAALGIHWVPCRWRSGCLKLLKKGLDFLVGLKLALSLKCKPGFNRIIAQGSLAGGMALVISELTRTPLMLLSFEPHSEFMVQTGSWPASATQSRLLAFLEQKSSQRAKLIFASSLNMTRRLHGKSPATVFHLPSCVDPDRFSVCGRDRSLLRRRFGFSETARVVLYLGKFGELYLGGELFRFFRFLQDQLTGETAFLILSPCEPKTIEHRCNQAGLVTFKVLHVTYDEVPHYMGCADLGITGIPPTPSMCFRSPIKNGEYWAAGLPVISYSGVGDDAELIRRERIGVIVEDPSPGSWKRCAEELETLLALDRRQLAARCRRAARIHRNIHHGVALFLKGLRQVAG